MVLPIGPQLSGTTRGTGAVGEKPASGNPFSPIIAILPRSLQSSLLNQLAGQTTAARLVSLSAGGMAQIDVRGTPLEVQLKNIPPGQNPGDTVLINFRSEDTPDSPTALTIRDSTIERNAMTRGAEALRTESLAVAKPLETNSTDVPQRLSDAGKLLGTLSRIESEAAPFSIAVNLSAGDDLSSPGLMAGTPTSLRSFDTNRTDLPTAAQMATATDQAIVKFAAQALQDMVKAIETSGLFYEAHLQQWNEGDRAEDDLRKEPQASWTDADALDDGNLPDSAQARDSVRTVAAQLGQLERPSLHMTLPGFFNDRVDLSIEPDQQSRQRDTKTPPAWFATIRMDLPHLGPLELRMTLMDSQCRVTVKTDDANIAQISAGFPDLMSAMSAAGLTLQAQTDNRSQSDEPTN